MDLENAQVLEHVARLKVDGVRLDQYLVNVFGADHIGYIPRMLAAVAAFTGGTVERDAKGKLKSWQTTGGTSDLAIKVVNLVKLFKNGEPYK